MLPRVRQSDSHEWFGREVELSTAVLKVLGDCYVRESQHAMRYRQHAERIHSPEFAKSYCESPPKSKSMLNPLA